MLVVQVKRYKMQTIMAHSLVNWKVCSFSEQKMDKVRERFELDSHNLPVHILHYFDDCQSKLYSCLLIPSVSGCLLFMSIRGVDGDTTNLAL